MGKKLTINKIKEQAKKYSKTQKIVLYDGSELLIYPHFSQTKIDEYIQEYFQDISDAEKQGIKLEELSMEHWAYFNIIKKFSNLEIPNGVKEKIQVFIALIETPYLGEIIKHYPQESILQLMARLDEVNERLDIINNMKPEEKEQLLKNFNKLEDIDGKTV